MILISSLFLLPWTGEVSGGGISNIAAVDLFANHASSIYYDDISLPPPAKPALPAFTCEVKPIHVDPQHPATPAGCCGLIWIAQRQI